MKTYTEQEVIELFEKFEKDRISYFSDKIRIFLSIHTWLQDNRINKNYVGQKYEDIKCYYDLNYRIVKQDGHHYMLTQDVQQKRLNFEIENGIITKQYNG